MDGRAQVAQSVDMNATTAVHASERNLQMIIDTIAELACQPTPGATGASGEAPANGSLRYASINRLACLFRHWTWADEAMARFEQELAEGWEYGEDLLADRPFGAYYHWCALLCGFSEAALEHAFLSELQLQALRPDLEASLPGLRACRQLLVVIPASLEEHPRIVDLLRDSQTLDRLRRIHYAFGAALREEQMSRALELLLFEH